jgi:phospholipid transport system transporter-binding protein
VTRVANTQIVRDGAFRFHVEGEMTFATANELLRQSATYFQKPQDLEIDLSRVTAADSAGLALLLEWKARAAGDGAEVSVVGLPEAMQSIAHLCRIEDLLRDADPDLTRKP